MAWLGGWSIVIGMAPRDPVMAAIYGVPVASIRDRGKVLAGFSQPNTGGPIRTRSAKPCRIYGQPCLVDGSDLKRLSILARNPMNAGILRTSPRFAA